MGRLLTLLLLLLSTSTVQAAEQMPRLEPPLWSVIPFVLLLLGIAVLPLVVEHFWHSNRNKAIVVGLLAAPMVGFLLAQGHAGTAHLIHGIEEYLSFIILLMALYVISGGIVLSGDIRGLPITNVGFLAFGAVLANLIGTTGASMVLIRPMLRINQQRRNTFHLPIFFIFVVSNCGGLLTPLGDPPLFLGFLNGVDFFWTTRLFPQWVTVNGILLASFYIWDRRAYARETKTALTRDDREIEPLAIRGVRVNGPALFGVIAAVLLQSSQIGRALGIPFGVDLTLHKPFGELIMIACTLIAYRLTKPQLRQANGYAWGPIVEVAILFIGIFITMVPAIAILKTSGPKLGIDKPWEFFWLTGILSSFLDNAPTYAAFAALASGDRQGLTWLMTTHPELLAAISCGAVFMGANSYIGNGPNFMVKAIAEEQGYRMPSFGGYLVYSTLILLPIFGVVTLIYFA